MEELNHALKELGLTPGERKVLSCVIAGGDMNAGSIVKNSGISRSKVYDIIANLEQKSLLSSFIQNGVLTVRCLPPKAMEEKIDRKIKRLSAGKEILSRLISEQASDKPQVRTFIGYDGFKAYFSYIQKHHAASDYFGLSFTDEARDFKPYLRLCDNFLKEHAAKGKKAYILCSMKWKLNTNKAALNSENYEYRYTDSPFPPNVDITKSFVSFTTWKPVPSIILIEHKETAAEFMDYFKSLWKNAKKI